MDLHPVVRFEFGARHGWRIGRTEVCGLLPGEEAAWPDQWLRYTEASGIDLTDLTFRSAEEQAAFVDFPYPDAMQLSRGLPLVKWLLAIPHWIVLWFLHIGAFIAVVIAWFSILFTGVYPRSLFDFVVGVNRWTLRVAAYAILLTTDQYPPFSLD